jgi:hypothetical protein
VKWPAETRVAIWMVVLVLVMLFGIALYGYLSGAWETVQV